MPRSEMLTCISGPLPFFARTARTPSQAGSPPYLRALVIRFCRHCDSPNGSPMTGGRSRLDVALDADPRRLNQLGRCRERGVDHFRHVNRPQHVAVRRVADRREQQHLFDQRRQPSGLAADDRPVLRDLLAFVNDPERDVVGGGRDDGDRRAQIVRDGGHEIHLQPARAAAPGD